MCITDRKRERQLWITSHQDILEAPTRDFSGCGPLASWGLWGQFLGAFSVQGKLSGRGFTCIQSSSGNLSPMPPTQFCLWLVPLGLPFSWRGNTFKTQTDIPEPNSTEHLLSEPCSSPPWGVYGLCMLTLKRQQGDYTMSHGPWAGAVLRPTQGPVVPRITRG